MMIKICGCAKFFPGDGEDVEYLENVTVLDTDEGDGLLTITARVPDSDENSQWLEFELNRDGAQILLERLTAYLG